MGGGTRAKLVARQLTSPEDRTMARKTAATNELALDAFLAAKAEIDLILAELASLSAEHFYADPEGINWGHVGSANHIRDRLQDVANFATGKA
jgi:hypothetical protein